jgi:hypothetical protein
MAQCIRCGFCCLSGPCSVRLELHGEGHKTRCPELYRDGDLYGCHVAQIYGKKLGVGKGCHMPINPWRCRGARPGEGKLT